MVPSFVRGSWIPDIWIDCWRGPAWMHREMRRRRRWRRSPRGCLLGWTRGRLHEGKRTGRARRRFRIGSGRGESKHCSEVEWKKILTAKAAKGARRSRRRDQGLSTVLWHDLRRQYRWKELPAGVGAGRWTLGVPGGWERSGDRCGAGGAGSAVDH